MTSVSFAPSDILLTCSFQPDKREFLKISQAVGIGFLIMGAIGFVVKLIHIPVNNILVS
jgi:protein translocase SEC61 complex gamma subunit